MRRKFAVPGAYRLASCCFWSAGVRSEEMTLDEAKEQTLLMVQER
jgi:hypothetical protein